MLRKETVKCPALVCRFQTSVPSTFRGHFSRKHKDLKLNAITFKRELCIGASEGPINELSVNGHDNGNVGDDTFFENNRDDDNTVHTDVLLALKLISSLRCSF